MKINKKIIEKLTPCKDRFDNFLNQYPDFKGDIKDFVLLDKITYSDKVWVVTRLFTKEQNVKWSLLCASKVLSIFEKEYPDDKRPRQALEACENWLNNPSDAAANAANAAANAAYVAANAAANAAYVAANAAYAAYVAANAANAAANAAYVAANAANAAAYAAANANARDEEEMVNLLLMIECL